MIQSVQRALAGLEAVVASANGLTARDVAAHLGIRETTASNLLGTLVQLEYLQRTGRPARYKSGPALRRLRQCDNGESWVRSLHTAIRAVRESCPWAIVVGAVAHGPDIRMEWRESPQRPGVIEHLEGRSVTPYLNAVGLAYLAFWDDFTRNQYFKLHPFSEYGEGIWGNREDFQSALQEFRHEGIAVARNRDYWRAAVPCYSDTHRLVAVLGASEESESPRSAKERSKLLRALKHQAEIFGRATSAG